MGFSRQEYQSGLLFPPGDLPDPQIEPASLVSLHWQADSFPLSHQGSLGCGDFYLILFRSDFARDLIYEE